MAIVWVERKKNEDKREKYAETELIDLNGNMN